jgi:hypothetical protein
MNEAAIKQRILELSESLVKAPTANGDAGIYVAQAPSDQPSVDETLDNLRLQLRYLMFDLEATRRENRYLRQMLESRPPFRKRDEDARGEA